MRSKIPALLVAILTAASVFGATFVVPPDPELIHRADAIVIGNALLSYARTTAAGGIETVTPLSIETVIKGTVLDQTIDVVEPGGVLDRRAMLIAGVPRFSEGARMLLFLTKTGQDRWSVTEIALGKFSFEHGVNGERLLLRDTSEIAGWDPDLQPHRERPRSADGFLRFIGDEVAGRKGTADYFVDPTTRLMPRATSLQPAPAVAPFTATSYTMVISGSQGSRWNVFPNAVSFFSGASGEPGAPGGGATAVQTGINSWDNDSGSNVNYVYAGTDSTHTQGLHGPDGANTVLFERDLSAWGVAPFSCSGSNYSGVLGLGGITTASGSNTVSGETFVTTLEGDVEMNKGLANCNVLFNSGDFNSAVTHELGHTLGFRHADQTRSGSAACSTDPSLECSSSAIMKSFITTGLNAALQQWDIDAVRAVYPGTTPPPCTAPTITAQPQSKTIQQGQSATLSVTATGTTPLSYQWYIGSSGNTSNPISGATGPSTTVTLANNYWVRVSNACGSVNSATATVTVTQPPPPPPATRYVHGDYNGDGRTDLTVYRPSNGTWFIQAIATVQWGSSGDQPMPNDYDGDGKADICVYRPSTGVWFFRYSSTGATPQVQFGSPGDIPVPADYDGDGRADVAVFRPSTGVWYITFSSNGSGSATQFGVNGDRPVPADYNGDGKAEIAVYRPSNGTWFILGVGQTQFGSPGDIPVPADYDGDRKTDIAVYRPSTGVWYFIFSSTGFGGSTQFGSSGDQPVPGDYDGDGKYDIAVYRPSNSVWFFLYSSTRAGASTQWGSSGDTPLNQ